MEERDHSKWRNFITQVSGISCLEDLVYGWKKENDSHWRNYISVSIERVQRWFSGGGRALKSNQVVMVEGPSLMGYGPVDTFGFDMMGYKAVGFHLILEHLVVPLPWKAPNDSKEIQRP